MPEHAADGGTGRGPHDGAGVGYRPEDVPVVDLTATEVAVQGALGRGDGRGLTLLGYGEISLVVGWPTDSPVVAAKRLPPFPYPSAAAEYGRQFTRYLDRLVDRGVVPVPSAFRVVPGDGPTVAYVVQGVLDPEDLGPALMRRTPPAAEHPMVVGIVAAIGAVCDSRTGLDAQLSNWAMVDGELRYLDVTTPMLFDDAGRSELDLGLFLAAYPWALRGIIRRFVAPGVIGAYRDPRHVGVDLAANLHKERLTEWIPAVLAALAAVGSAGAVADRPVDAAEVRRTYRSDARLWETMLRLRRADRWWQRRVRRRPYPFLLPGHIER